MKWRYFPVILILTAVALDFVLVSLLARYSEDRRQQIQQAWTAHSMDEFERHTAQLFHRAQERLAANPVIEWADLLPEHEIALKDLHVLCFDAAGEPVSPTHISPRAEALLPPSYIRDRYNRGLLDGDTRFVTAEPINDALDQGRLSASGMVFPLQQRVLTVLRSHDAGAARLAILHEQDLALAGRDRILLRVALWLPVAAALLLLFKFRRAIPSQTPLRHGPSGMGPPEAPKHPKERRQITEINPYRLELIELRGDRDRLLQERATALTQSAQQVHEELSLNFDSALDALCVTAFQMLTGNDATSPATLPPPKVLEPFRVEGHPGLMLYGELRNDRNLARAPQPYPVEDCLNALRQDWAEQTQIIFETPAFPIETTLPQPILAYALWELVSNALDALADGQPVTLALEPPSAGEPARITIRDSGPGMSPALRKRCETPFLTTKSGRPGLGLSLTRLLLHRSGAKLQLHSEAGFGVIAVIALPETAAQQ